MTRAASASGPLHVPWTFTSLPRSLAVPVAIVLACLIPIVLLAMGMPIHFPAYSPRLDTAGSLLTTSYAALGGGFTHSILLASAGSVALCSALLSFAHSATKKDVLSAVIAIALFWSGFTSLGQVLWAEGLLYWAADVTDFIPFTWAISRLFNSIILVTGAGIVYLGRNRSRSAPRPRQLLVLFLIFGALAVAVVWFTAHSNLPQTIYPDGFIKRPWDLPALVLLLFGALVVFPKLHRHVQNLFSYALWLSTLPLIAAQLYLILGSTAIFDDPFNIAYGLNVLAFLVLFAGLIAEYVRTSTEEEHLKEERKQTQMKLIQLDRLSTMGTLAASVGHELNNPLAFLIANLDYGREELEELVVIPENFRDLETLERLKELQDILSSSGVGAERIRTIVNDLRLLSSFQQSNEDTMCVRKALETAIRMSRHELRSRARVIEEIDEIPLIGGNEARLTQVLLNLIVNAAQAMPARAVSQNEIYARGFATNHSVVVEITDNGAGIPPENLELIFDPFFTTKPAGEGSGLGLALSRDIIESMHGRLTVTSTKGKGSTFRIELPR
jgi:signal transduction histidine kinase